MNANSAPRLAGLALLFVCVVGLLALLRHPELTYAPGDQSQAETRGDSVVRCGPVPHYEDGVRRQGPPQLEVLEGNLRIVDAADIPDAAVEIGDPVVSTEQVSADCATERARRLAFSWLPGLGAMAGLLLLFRTPSGRRGAPAPTT